MARNRDSRQGRNQLPPGHEPGAQSRRAARGVPVAIVLLSLATAGLAPRFTVPADSPFSYEGGPVSWAWHVALRDRHPHRLDAYRDVPIWVSP